MEMKKKENFDLVEIGLRMKYVRSHLRKTQANMAADLGISLSHYSKLEVGIGGMSHGLIYTFCNIYDVDQNWFVYGKGELPVLNPDRAIVGSVPGEIPNLEEKLEKIIQYVLDPGISILASQIAASTNISKARAFALLIKEKIRTPEEPPVEAAPAHDAPVEVDYPEKDSSDN